MPTVNRKFGQHFLLSRTAIRLRRFTVADLHRATDVPENTIYSFVSRLMERPGSVETEELLSVRPGRPRKRYSLTELGLDYLLRRNALVVSLLQGERTSGTAPVIPNTPAAVTAPAPSATPNVAAWYSSAAADRKPSQEPAVRAKRKDESDENRAAAY
jgi:DNA-binding PadR family transcriptional regulator